MMVGKQNISRKQEGGVLLVVYAALFLALSLLGCEADSFMDPSILGRWERTPVVLPILDRIDVIDEPIRPIEGLSQVQPEDLIPIVREYVIGPGDTITITVFELMQASAESVVTRRVDELAMIRLPMIGPIKAGGQTSSGLEKMIIQILDEKGILKDAMVSAIVVDGRQNTFSVIGDPGGGAGIGSYLIPKSDFRLLEAMALAGGVSDQIEKIHVIRRLPLTQVHQLAPLGDVPSQKDVTPSPREAVDLIEDLLRSVDEDFQIPGNETQDQDQMGQAPAALDQSMDALIDQPFHWAYVNGKWVRIDQAAAAKKKSTTAAKMLADSDQEGETVTHRVIEVPYRDLLKHDMRYNLVIRSGDMIRVQPTVAGNVYIGGAISRPGTYALPGVDLLTVKQLIFAAGNLSPSAIPQRVDLIRRLDNDQEATVRLNLKAIFDGSQPDFYLKPNDTLNIGTSFASVPLAIFRNGLRFSYGFGFVLDRNFGSDVFGPANNN